MFSIDLFKKDVESKNRSYKKKDSTRRFLVSTKKVNDHRKTCALAVWLTKLSHKNLLLLTSFYGIFYISTFFVIYTQAWAKVSGKFQ